LHTAKQRRPAIGDCLDIANRRSHARVMPGSPTLDSTKSMELGREVFPMLLARRPDSPTVQHGRAYHRLLLLQIEPRRRLARAQETLRNATINQIRSPRMRKCRKEPSILG
jgi:hypothetical protein